MTTIENADLNNKTVLIRLDLNVPVQDHVVSDFTRIDRVKPTIDLLRKKGAKTVILSHFGRPKAKADPELSLTFLQPVLTQHWGCQVSFANDCTGNVAKDAVAHLKSGDVLLLENVRFHPGEEKDDPAFAQQLASLGDVYVNDAFSVSHRAHASVHAIAKILPALPGLSMQAELNALSAAVANPKRPVAAIVGGAKVSTKLDLLGNLVTKMDYLVLGGGMANTFLASQGWNPEASLYEADMLDTAREISARAQESGCRIILPTDGVMAAGYAADAEHRITSRPDIPAGWQVLDIGPDSVHLITEALEDCKTIVWNGPMGVFEWPNFAKGTNALAKWVADRTQSGRIVSVAGGGDTVSALAQAGVIDQMSYVSTAGGAFLEWLEGKDLPGVSVLTETRKAA